MRYSVRIGSVVGAACLWLFGTTMGMVSSIGDRYVQVVASDWTGVTLEVRAPEPEVGQTVVGGRSFATVHAQGLEPILEEGKPKIPGLGRWIAVPPDAVCSARLLEEEVHERTVGWVEPYVPMALSGGEFKDTPPSDVHMDRALYEQPQIYPASPVSVQPLGLVRDLRLARILLYPYQLILPEGRLLYRSRMVIRMDFRYPRGKVAGASKPVPSVPVGESPYVDRMLSNQVLNYEQAERFRQGRPTERPLARVAVDDDATLTEGTRIRIVVREEGLYRIDREQLRKAEVDLTGVDPRMLRITSRGREIPILVQGEEDGSLDVGDGIEFWGEPNYETATDPYIDRYMDRYTEENVYWLSVGFSRGMRLATESGAVVETDPLRYHRPFSYAFTVHAEQDRYRDRLARLPEEDGDRWFWDSGIFGGRLGEYEVTLPNPDQNAWTPAVVTTVLRGKTYPDGFPDHHALVYLNDVRVGEGIWDGQALVRWVSDESRLLGGHLNHGKNVLRVVLPGDEQSAGPGDAVYLNWFEVTYPRLYWAHRNYIKFTKPPEELGGLYHFVVGGFTSPRIEVYKNGISRIINTVIRKVEDEEQGVYYQLIFQDEIHDKEPAYIALTPDQKKPPVRMERDMSSTLRSPDNEADYILITHELFYETAFRLAQYRREQGLRVSMIEVQDIYDEFNDGIFSPEAIRAFLRYAYAHWRPPAPSFVVLVGDGTWDYRNILGRGHTFIPPAMVRTEKWGLTSSDYPYALVSGEDLLPDLFVGRLPVNTNVELETLIDKIIAYETSPDRGAWRKRVLFIGGVGQAFRDQSENLITEFVPSQFDASRLYVYSARPGEDPYFGGTQDLIDALDEGVALVNFMGHGGGAIWSDASLFQFEDVPRLHNRGRLPFVLSFTCFTGAFDEPYRSSLGEEFLKAEGKGAIGWLGSNGLGWLWHDYYLAQSMMRSFFSGRSRTMGGMITEGKVDFLSIYSGGLSHDMVHLYGLLGDPATRMGLPQDGMAVWVRGRRSVEPGEELHIQGTIRTPASGTAQITLVDAGGTAVEIASVPLTEGAFSAKVGIPSTMSEGVGRIKVYALSDKGEDWIGQARCSIGGFLVADVEVSPPLPMSSDSVQIGAALYVSRGEVARAWCVFPSRGDSVEMMGGEEYRWVTEQRVRGFSPGERVEYVVVATDQSGRWLVSNPLAFQVRRGTVLTVQEVFLTGVEEVQVAARIENEGDTESPPTPVRFFLGETIEEGAAIGQSTVPPLKPRWEQQTPNKEDFWQTGTAPGDPLEAAEGAATVISVPLRWPQRLVGPQTMLVQLGGVVHRAQVGIDRFSVSPEEGTGGAVVSTDGNLAMTLEGGGVTSPGVLSIVGQPEVPIVGQPDFSPVPVSGHPEGVRYEISFADSVDRMSGPALLTFRFDAGDSALRQERDNLKVGRWQADIAKWVSLGGTVSEEGVRLKTDRVGTFALLMVRDDTGPRIEMSVGDQQYVEDAFVSERPQISAMVRDENGINPEGVEIVLDEQPVDPLWVRVSKTTPTTNVLPINIFPYLKPGFHTLSIQVQDCAGNRSAKHVIRLRVAAEFDLIRLGNYPNPFGKYTIFTYALTRRARRVSFKVYTVAGRLMWQFPPQGEEDVLDDFQLRPTDPEYHEIEWDGTDATGTELANGTYFCRVKAVSEDGKETVEKTMKLAKVR